MVEPLTPDRYLGKDIFLSTFVDTRRGEMWLELVELGGCSEPISLAHFMVKLTKDIYPNKVREVWEEIKKWVKEVVDIELGKEDYLWFETLLEFFWVMFTYYPPDSWKVG